MNVKWRPKGGLVGDAIPFYWKGEYHIFCLKAPESSNPVLRFKTSWGHLTSTDLIHWEELPVTLEPGPQGSPDTAGVWTGSVIEREGLFHIFYTGYNSKDPVYPQTICHATSKDLIKWKKDYDNPVLKSDPERYETKDWRDPYVFWNEDSKEYWMLLTARTKSGPFLRRGCIVLVTSDDLTRWKIDSNFWCPNLCFCIECPDLFRWDNKWYLIWSKFSNPVGTYYRIADSIKGPWCTPPAHRLDGKYFYAAKTAGDGSRRFAFAWIPVRLGEWDSGYWEWGGDLVIPHELIKQDDGTLAFRCPSEIINSYTRTLSVDIKAHLGKWNKQGQTIKGERMDGLGYATIPVETDDFLLEISVSFEAGTPSAGILLRADYDFSQGYMVRLDPVFQRVVIDHWPLPVDVPWLALTPPGLSASTDPSPLVEQPLKIIVGKPIECKIFISNSTIQVFVDECVALSYRIYKTTGSPLGLFVEEGRVQFDNVSLKTR